MRKRIVVVAMLLLARECIAGDRIGGAVGITSDYVFRGISQTYGRAALQADLHYVTPQGFSAGLWASTIELNPWEGRTVELNVYAGYRWSINSDWTAKASTTHYDYPQNDRFQYDYNELAGSLGFRNMLFLNVAWSFDASRYATRVDSKTGDSIAYDAAVALPLPGSFTANAGVGYHDLHSVLGTGYVFWNAGLSYDRQPWRLDLNYIGAGAAPERLFYGNVAGKRLAVSLNWRF